MLTVEHNSSIALVTIDRPDKVNSLPVDGKRELAATIRDLTANGSTEGIVITGSGSKAFCAGSDVNEMRHFGMAEMDYMLTAEREMYQSIMESPKPVVASVAGFALGAGLILAMSCDYTVASVDASFGTPELTIGVAAPLEGLLLPYFVGLARARAMFYSNHRLDTKEALAFGLINEVSPSPLERSFEVVRQIASLPAQGFEIQKDLLRSLLVDGSGEAVMQRSHQLTSRQFRSKEVGSAMSNFFNDRRK